MLAWLIQKDAANLHLFFGVNMKMSKETPEIVLHPEISKWRRTSEDKNLRRDLKERGQLQNMVFRRLPDGKLELLAGNSRYRELTTLKVPFEKWDMKILEGISDRNALLIAMSENRFRRKLSAVEEGRMFRSMMKQKMHLEEIAVRYRVSEKYVKTRLELLKLPENIQDLMEQGEIVMSYAKPLIRLNDLPEAQKELVKAIKLGNQRSYEGIHTVEEADQAVDKLLEHIRITQGLVAKYGPCPQCGSKDIGTTYYKGQLKCNNNKCNYEWHGETKEPWKYYELKEEAQKMGLKLQIGKDGKAELSPEDVRTVMKRIEDAKETPLPKTLRSTHILSELLAPLIKPENLHLIRVEGDRIQVKLVEDVGLRFSARRHNYKTGEKTQIRPRRGWNEDEKEAIKRVLTYIKTLDRE